MVRHGSILAACLAPACALALAPAAAFCAGQSSQPVTERTLARIVKLTDPHFSPDGKQIAFVETRADLDDDAFHTEVMLLDVAGKSVRPLTRDRHHASAPRWSPKGDAIAFIAPDADKVNQIFVAPMNGGDALQLTHVKDGSDISQFAWSPDASQIAYVAADPKPDKTGEDKHRDEFDIHHDDFTTTEAPRPSHVWLVASAGGKARRLTSGAWSLPSSLPPGPPSSPIQWTPDGKSLVIVRQETPSTGDQFESRIQVLDVASGALRYLTGLPDFEGYPLVSPDGQTVAFWRNRDGKAYTYQDIWLAPIAGGSAKDIGLTLDKNVYGTWWLPNGKGLLAGANDGTGVGLWQLAQDGTPTRIDLGTADNGGIVPSANYWVDTDVSSSGAIATVAQTTTDPYEIYLVTQGAKPVQLTSENTSLSDLKLARQETFTWKGPNGRMLDGVVTTPPDATPGKTYPLVLNIHGGPNSASKQRFSLLPQMLAARGYIVFEPNYRGSDSAGNEFYAAIYQDAGDGPGRDVKSGIDALVKRGGIDTSRIAVTGWSYGGFMTVWMLGHYSSLFKAAVAGASLTDWVNAYNLSDGNVSTALSFGGSPYSANNMANYLRQSPSSALAKITAPTLVMSDTGDYRVQPMDSFALYRALEANHVPTEFLAFPTGGHFPGDPIRQMDVYRRWADWLGKYL